MCHYTTKYTTTLESKHVNHSVKPIVVLGT